MGISIGATNLAATYGSQSVVQPAMLRTAQGGWLSGFVDRIGDPVPLIGSDGSTHRPEALLAEALEATVIAATHGAAVSDIAMAVPAHWSPSTVAALRMGGTDDRRLVSDATAAAWAIHDDVRLPSRGVLVLCDFGGSGTSITLLDAGAEFARIGETVRVNDFSGDLVDQAILGKVVVELADGGRMDPGATSMVGSLARLRQSCRLAKHRLSGETATAIAVELPDMATSIRLTRPELEALVAEPLAVVMAELEDTLLRNGVVHQDVQAVATVGGGARMPLLTQTLSHHLRTPVVTSPHPHLLAAKGAALMAARAETHDAPTELSRTTMAPPVADEHTVAVDRPAALAWSQAEPDDLGEFDMLELLAASRPDVEFEHAPDGGWDETPRRRRGPLIAFLAASAAAVAALAVFGMTSFASEPAPANAVSTIAVSTAPVSSTQLPVSAASESQPVTQPAEEPAAPRLVPVGRSQPRQPAPPVAPITAAPVTTTTTTPTTTTTTTPTTTTSTTTPTSSTTTSTPTSSTTTPTAAPEMPIKPPITIKTQPSVKP